MATAEGGATLLGLAAGFNLVGNLVFHTLVARRSSVPSYGVTSLFLSFGVLAGVLSSGFQYATARQVVRGTTTMGAEFAKVVPWLALVVPFGAFVVAYPPIGGFVHVDDPTALALAVAYLAITVGQAVPLGMLNGGRRFGALTVCVFIGVTVRVVLFPLLVGGHQTTVTALVSSDVSTLVATAVAVGFVLRRPPSRSAGSLQGQVPGPAPRARGRGAGSTEGPVGAVLGAGLWGSWILSLVFARHYLTPHEAGIFSVSHVAAGAILFLAAPIVTAYMPSVAGSATSVRPVVVGLLLTASVAVVSVAGLVALGRPVVAALYGSRYPPPLPLLAAQGLAASVVACTTFLLWAARSQQVRLLVHRRAFVVGVPLALALEVLAGDLWHGSAVALALGPGAAVAVGVAVGALVEARGESGRRPGPLGPTAHRSWPKRARTAATFDRASGSSPPASPPRTRRVE